MRIHWLRTFTNKRNAPLRPAHLRFHRSRDGSGMLHCVVLDCSASMVVGGGLALAKGLLAAWVKQMYRQRADLVVIGFTGRQARVLRPLRKASAFDEGWLAPLAGGGGSPLGSALATVDEVLARARRQVPERHIGLWLLTDGRVPECPPRPQYADSCTVVDFERGALPLGGAVRLACAWRSDYLPARVFID